MGSGLGITKCSHHVMLQGDGSIPGIGFCLCSSSRHSGGLWRDNYIDTTAHEIDKICKQATPRLSFRRRLIVHVSWSSTPWATIVDCCKHENPPYSAQPTVSARQHAGNALPHTCQGPSGWSIRVVQGASLGSPSARDIPRCLPSRPFAPRIPSSNCSTPIQLRANTARRLVIDLLFLRPPPPPALKIFCSVSCDTISTLTESLVIVP